MQLNSRKSQPHETKSRILTHSGAPRSWWQGGDHSSHPICPFPALPSLSFLTARYGGLWERCMLPLRAQAMPGRQTLFCAFWLYSLPVFFTNKNCCMPMGDAPPHPPPPGSATAATHNIYMLYNTTCHFATPPPSPGSGDSTRPSYFIFRYPLTLSHRTSRDAVNPFSTQPPSLTSLFSFLRTLTMWYYPRAPTPSRAAVRRAAIDRYLLPAGPTAANLQQQTDGRMDALPFHRLCSACYTGSADIYLFLFICIRPQVHTTTTNTHTNNK